MSKKYFRSISQIIFLSLFGLLLYLNKLQLWIVVFILGIILSLGLGRLYCGWICPMYTLSRPIRWLKNKLSLGGLKTPNLLKSKILRYSVVFIFLGSMIIFNVLNIKLPVIFIITIIGVAFLVIFDEELFHKHLCPFGTILSITSKPSKFVIKIDEQKCIGCGKCQKVCPVECILYKKN